MEIQVGVSKINKYAVSESGDTCEVIERPGGGISVVLADGQRSGKSAKRISTMVVRKVISLLAEGVRDGAAARAASDYLYSERGGKVQSTLNIISYDLASKTIVITRNNPEPMYIIRNGDVEILNEDSISVGVRKNTRPSIHEIDIEENILIVMFSDGVVHAGTRKGQYLDLPKILLDASYSGLTPQWIADKIMDMALELDENRPVDDISIAVFGVLPTTGDNVRRLTVGFPVR